MPDSGTISPTLTSAGVCARATPARPIAAAPDSTVRRVNPLDVLPLDALFICRLPGLLFLFVTCRDRLFAPGRRRAAYRCCLRARRGRLRGHSRDRLTPAPPRRAARPAAWSARTGAGYRSAARR